MKFKWDSSKNRANLRKHGFDLSDAIPMFDGPMLANPDIREDYAEDRWIGIGTTNGRIAVVVFVEPVNDVIRIISLRKASQRERRLFEKALADKLEAD